MARPQSPRTVQILAIAKHAVCGERSVRRYLAGDSMYATTITRIERAIAELDCPARAKERADAIASKGPYVKAA